MKPIDFSTHRIEVCPTVPDARAQVRKKKIELMGFGRKIESVFLADVYTIDKTFVPGELKKITNALINPITQRAHIDTFYRPSYFGWAIEIGYLPGVTDNIATTTKEIIEDLLKNPFRQTEGIYTSQLIFLSGKLTASDIHCIASGLINPLIQRIIIKSAAQYVKEEGMGKTVPKVKMDHAPRVDTVNLDVLDDELTVIGKSGIADRDGSRRGPLALDLTYMKAIQTYFKKAKRNPTDIELESIAQTWSEHCKHTIFSDPLDEVKNGLFKTYIRAATEKIRKQKGKQDMCLSVFTDNSGAIEFDEKYAITHKAETHNSPSALDPYGGAITGIVGVNRDTIGFGKGAKPIINIYGFCFADPTAKTVLYKDRELKQKMLSPDRIMTGVIEGVNNGGNCSGIPTPQGFVVFDNRYIGKPLVFVGTVGLIPKKIHGRLAFSKKAEPDNYIVMVGGRVGQDGIHGATFSSEALDSGSPATAVQIGDPITQKKLSDAIVKEARDRKLYTSITDNGAGGLSCSVAEMAKEAGGCKVQLEKVPLKYPGLDPWKIWISESQERMTLAVPKNKWKEFNGLMKKRSVEATIIGTFTKSGFCQVTYNNKTIMNIDMEFLHDGLPPRPMTTIYKTSLHVEPKIKKIKNLTLTLTTMLSRLNIASFEFISMQYDHEVQGTSVIKPLQGKGRVNGDASVVKPVLSSKKGVIISQGILPHYSDIDTYHMAGCSIDTAIRSAVTSGADPNRLALLDNFCWCSSTEPQRLGQLKRAAQACFDCAVAFKTPFISGKDSMFNDFKGYDKKGKPIKISIPPTLLISSIGVVDDVTKTVSIDLKSPGDLIYILGETHEELGGSEYFNMMGYIGNVAPSVNARKNLKLYKAFSQCAKKNLIASAISVNRGGIGVALAKSAIAGMLGIDVSLKSVPGAVFRVDFALFSESQGRIVATVNPKNKKTFEKNMKGVPHAVIGKVTSNNFILMKDLSNETIIKLYLDKASEAYKSRFKNY
ncbi:phosphoribosylformylglycinamidine synthase [Candidatus Roizmanbacteria bacterium CG09_land_8_20_14_0_10_41_9]|uniref:Phosphoribosylformylglycinamidine synthase subunit PurL n=1 Tax=Candidatus Roizmanbacteria bacterium CG09_land_8_20_14_0_10_41_9 TaxID=1974850 RepID=A0A2H0WTP9_9BACT|nr:MAG: phosphoribosylformylglycinamidine synthase [Candidatus Roizmanbacteria bacterium CG09_land_8_20_14_0_10_41_9]